MPARAILAFQETYEKSCAAGYRRETSHSVSNG